mgnify:CR=1 FL=1
MNIKGRLFEKQYIFYFEGMYDKSRIIYWHELWNIYQSFNNIERVYYDL